jgi:hypothetical protein
MIPEGPLCVPKMSLNCTKLSLGTFQAHKEPLGVSQTGALLGPLGTLCGPENVCRRPFEDPGP